MSGANGTVKRLFTNLLDLLFGYDFFISYAHADGSEYPRMLADQLQETGFTVFLDAREYVPGDDLKVATRRRIRMSRKLVVIARPRALESDWVLKEVEECVAAGRTPIVIDINRTLEGADANAPVKTLLEDKLYISETIDVPMAEPSSHVVAELTRSFRSTRRETLRLRVAGAVAAVLFLTTLAALWQSHNAIRERERATEERDRAQANAAAYKTTCETMKREVSRGQKIISGLATTQFGALVSTIATGLARLPDVDGLDCVPPGDRDAASG